MSVKPCLAFGARASLLLLLPLACLIGCGGGEGQPFGGGGFLGRGGTTGTGGITGKGGETPSGGAPGSAGAGVGGQLGTGGVVATGGSSVGGASATGGAGVGGRASGGTIGSGGSGVGGKAVGSGGAGGKASGGTSAGGAGGKASGGAPGTGGVVSTGGSAGRGAGGAGGAGGGSGTGGSGPDCATLANQYDAELQKNARNCTTNTAGACAVKVPQNLTCMSSCITFVEDSSGRLQKIYTSWQDAGCAKRTMICPTLIACVNPKGASCVANLTTGGATTTSEVAAAPIIGLPGTCQDDTGATTQ